MSEGNKASLVRKRIESSNKGKDRSNTNTHELIKWAYFMGAINDVERSNLLDFNKKRNDIIHGHGQWWHSKTHMQALNK